MNHHAPNLFFLVIVSSLMAVAQPAFASIEGLWRTPTDNGEVRIELCGKNICGRLVTSDRLKAFPGQRDVRNHDKSARGRTLEGVLIAQDFSGGPTRWNGGTVYDPSGGGTYSGYLTLTAPDSLKLTGCIIAPLCRSQVWTRIGPS